MDISVGRSLFIKAPRTVDIFMWEVVFVFTTNVKSHELSDAAVDGVDKLL